jgi:hypothetical protein
VKGRSISVEFKKKSDSTAIYEIYNNDVTLVLEVYPNGQPKKLNYELTKLSDGFEKIDPIPTEIVYFEKSMYLYSHSFPLEYFENGKIHKRLIDYRDSLHFIYFTFNEKGDTISRVNVDRNIYYPK